jgi:hypothetical protein
LSQETIFSAAVADLTISPPDTMIVSSEPCLSGALAVFA